MSYYKIEWYGMPETTARNVTGFPAPRGGKHVRTYEQTEKMLSRWLDRCRYLSGTVRSAHSPRIVKKD